MRAFRRLLVAVLFLLFALTGSHRFRPFKSYYTLDAQTAGIAGIHVVGQPQLVFDHLVDKKEPNHLPDLPTTAWKEANGTVNVTVPHFENYRMRGPDLEHVVSSPNPIFSSAASASDIVESHYDYHHWLAAPYTFDGLTIYALAHTEWYACLIYGDCSVTTPPTPTSTGSYLLNSWANTLNSLVSTDGGSSWTTNGLNGAHVVSNESLTWSGSPPLDPALYRKALNHSGMMTPSRIVKEGSFYYSIAFLNHRDISHIDPFTSQAPIDKYDWVLMRTTDPTQAGGWEGWVSGGTFVPLSSHTFTAFSPRSGGVNLNAGEPQIIFDTNANLFIAIFVIWGAPGSVYYVTTPSLANPVWSDAVAIGGSASLQTNPRGPAGCSVGFQVNHYVSLIDTHSDGLNFEFTDGDPWLFYVSNPANNCGGDNLARDVYRVKLNVDYAAGPRPAFTAQPVSQNVIVGQNAQFTVATSGNPPTYQWQVSTNSGVSWTNLTNTAPYSGVTTAALLITGTTVGLTTTQYRCLATNSAGSATSNAATLTVTATSVVDDLVVDFGATFGLWLRNGETSTWSQLHTASAKSIVTGDLDGNGFNEVIVDFGPSFGLWIRANNATWIHLHTSTATRMVIGDLDGNGKAELLVDFPGFGIWVWQNNTSWFRLHASSGANIVTADLDGNGKGEAIIDFPGFGIWVWANNATWYQLHAVNSRLMTAGDFDGNGKGDLVVDFAGYGLWSYSNNSTWSLVHQFSASHLTAGDVDGNGQSDLIVDFGNPYGIWLLLNGTTWSQLHTLTSTNILTADLDSNGKADVIINFGAAGLWEYANNTSWVRLHTVSPGVIAVGRI